MIFYLYPIFRLFYFKIYSLLPGNIYIYLTLKTETIGRTARFQLFSIFSIIVIVSIIMFIFITWRSCMDQRRDNATKKDQIKRSSLTNIVQTLKISGQLLKTRNMLLLLILFIYLGKYFFC